MSSLPPNLILTNDAGLAKAVEGAATVWTRDVFAEPGASWKRVRGTVFMKAELDVSGGRVLVPMFRAYDGQADEPLSSFDGYTQP